MEKLSWKAVRNGDIYCAPACGADCTYDQYLSAHAKADALIEKCKKEIGGSWSKKVHENLGWHFSVTLIDGDITIHQYGDKYSVSSHAIGTPSVVNIRFSDGSIKKLIIEQLTKVKNEADRWNNYLDRNIKALNLKEITL